MIVRSDDDSLWPELGRISLDFAGEGVVVSPDLEEIAKELVFLAYVF